MNRRPVFSLITTLLIGMSLALSLPSSTFAQEVQPNLQLQSNPADQPATINSRIARLSFAQGDVQVLRPDEDWQTASINLPLQQGFRLATTDGRAEIQLESGVVLRLAEDSILEFTELDNGQNSGRITKLNLTQGTLIVTADLRPTDLFSVDAPNVHVTVQQPSRFRIDTTEGDSWVGIFAGDVMTKTEAGETKVTKGHTFHITGQDPHQVSIDMNAAPDDFDQWAANRDQTIQQGYRDAIQYVANYVPDYSEYNYGMSDLSSYGHWAVTAGCGLCWEPYGVPDHWRPFFFGSWEFFRGAGWTWISSEPWGWLPFHTGHWFARSGGGWMWQPGPIRAWNPAPVHWFNIGNQLGWAPAGTLNSHGQPPASGIVVGTRSATEARGVKITPGVRLPLSSELTEKITRASAPVVQQSTAQQSTVQRSEFHTGGPTNVSPVRPKNFPQDGAIRFDPATRTYMNAYPAPQPAPSAAADNSAVGVSTSGGGSASPHRPVPMRPMNTVQRPAYIAPPTQPQQHASPQPHYSPPPQPAPRPSSPPAQPHSAPPPAPVHTSPVVPVHH